MTNTTNTTATIVHFHIGRGGQFYNAGHKSFGGERDIQEVINLRDGDTHSLFSAKENENEIYRTLRRRGLDNLIDLFDQCREDDDFSKFEKRTGLSLGADIYVDHNGNGIISFDQVKTGEGVLNFDNDYDTDECKLLLDCDEHELKIIAEAGRHSLIREYFDAQIDGIDWSRIDEDRYSEMITSFFSPMFDIEDYYNDAD